VIGHPKSYFICYRLISSHALLFKLCGDEPSGCEVIIRGDVYVDRNNIAQGFRAVLYRKASNYARKVGESAWRKRSIRILNELVKSDYIKLESMSKRGIIYYIFRDRVVVSCPECHQIRTTTAPQAH
jgi:hypothetical protein